MPEISSWSRSFEMHSTWKKITESFLTSLKPKSLRTAKFRRCYEAMTKATAELLTNDDGEMMLKKIVHALVPEMAEWCLVNLAKPEGGLYRFSEARSMSRQKSEALDEIRRRFPPNPQAAHGLGHVIRNGVSELMSHADDRLYQGNSNDPSYMDLWRSLGIVSYIGVPIRVRGKIYGGISIDSMSPSRIYDESDLAFMQEIASLMGLALERMELLKQTHALSQQKDDFLALLSHELRTPISAVVGWSDLLLASPRNPKLDLKRVLEIIRKNALYQRDLVDDIRDISLVTLGHMKLDRRQINLVPVIQDCVETVTPQALSRAIAIDFQNKTGVATIYGDHSRIEQVILNVLTNAIKFTPPNGTISIEIMKDDDHFEVRIKDSGIGIDAKFLPFIFDRFRQMDNSMSRNYGGMGIGLALAQHIVHLHGGEITASSDGKDLGTCISIRLPKVFMSLLPQLTR